jgi:transcriptional regulator with PAS, ATPase and Fis domain
MPQGPSTVDIQYFQPGKESNTTPGVVAVFQGREPRFEVHPLVDGELEIGRLAPGGLTLDDRTMSRRHARLTFAAGHFEVEDLGSRNGLVADGKHVAPGQCKGVARTLRLGETILLLEPDVSPLKGAVRSEGQTIVGPRLREAWNNIDSVAAAGSVVHIRGESGTGKELAARRFHARRSGSFVPVNCAAIPHGVAERLLFGAKKGAFSGAHADAQGFVQAAHGGTLFLDEIGELDLEIQAKLLRVIESKTVLPIGEVRSQQVDFALVSATHQDLRKQIAQRSFREDLYFRVGRPEVELPALRDRGEEIPWLVDLTIRDSSSGLAASAALIECCLLRPWPGNVRELLLEAREAARRATLENKELVELEHLAPGAGLPHESKSDDSGADDKGARIDKTMLPERDVIETTLRETGGKVATAARKLGVHRNQLRRWLRENDVDPQSFS